MCAMPDTTRPRAGAHYRGRREHEHEPETHSQVASTSSHDASSTAASHATMNALDTPSRSSHVVAAGCARLRV